MKPLRRHRAAGAALLSAMITVALVATFAAAALWQQWRSTEVEASERARIQADWILTGALDWARLVLREDARAGSDASDWLGEPWAVPLQEARLSSFLAADPNQSADLGPGVLEAFLSGQVEDMQSRMNINNLLERGAVSENEVAAFGRLFELVGAPAEELSRLVENLRFATDVSPDNLSSREAPLAPQEVDDLRWLGVSPTTIALLRPYIAILPERTRVNLNTAPAEVIAAAADLSLAEAQTLVGARAQSHFRSIAEAQRLLSGGAAAMPEGQAGVTVASRFFEVHSRLRLDALAVREHALLMRDGMNVTVLRRQRGSGGADGPAASQAPNR